MENIIEEVSQIVSEANNLIYLTVATKQGGARDHTERFIKTKMIKLSDK